MLSSNKSSWTWLICLILIAGFLANSIASRSQAGTALNTLIALATTIAVAWAFWQTSKQQQAELEQKHAELAQINEQHEQQQEKIKQTANELELANKSLSGLNKEKDEFISIIAHDLRNPLNGILGLCELSQLDDSLVKKDSFVENIHNCGKRMLNLTEALLNVSRIEEFNGQVELEFLDWNACIIDAQSHHTDHAQQKRITIELDLDQTEGIEVSSKPDWLSICISNLISNAVKYTPICGVIILQSLRKPGALEIRIKDTGPGISEEDQRRMFEKFARLSARPTANESSVGLGLYVVKKMSDRLGIEIRVDSQLGEGTTFIMSLPL